MTFRGCGPALPTPGACAPSPPTGHTGKHWPPAGSRHAPFLTARVQKGKEITEIQCPEDICVPQGQLDGHSFAEVRARPATSGTQHGGDAACSGKTGGLEQAGTARHSPKRSDPQAPQTGGRGLFWPPHCEPSVLGTRSPTAQDRSHLPFPSSAAASASHSPWRRASTERHAFLLKCCLFPFLSFNFFFFPLPV